MFCVFFLPSCVSTLYLGIERLFSVLPLFFDFAAPLAEVSEFCGRWSRDLASALLPVFVIDFSFVLSPSPLLRALLRWGFYLGAPPSLPLLL